MSPTPKSTAPRYWLVKTEPDVFSIDDLARSKNQTTFWNGVRNYQARNFLRDEMRIGDRVLIYHSNADPLAIVGTAVVTREGYPDHTAQDPSSEYFDPKATPENPIWYMVDLRLESIFAWPIALEVLRRAPALKQMELLRKGSRLSVQPVRPGEFEAVLKLARDTTSDADEAETRRSKTVSQPGRTSMASAARTSKQSSSPKPRRRR